MKSAFYLTALAVALLIAIVASPYASSLPDGLDRFAHDHGVESSEAVMGAPMEDYTAPVGSNEALQTGVAGAIGTLLVFAILFFGGRMLTSQQGNTAG